MAWSIPSPRPSSLRRSLRLGAPILALALGSGCTALFDTNVEHEDDQEELEEPEPSVCESSTGPTPGEEGLLYFAYDYGAIACIFGCSADDAIAERSTVQINAYSDGDVDLPPVHVVSSDPDVATFDIRWDGDVIVQAHAPGQVRMELRDEDEALVEALTLTVSPVGSIALVDESLSPLSIMLGGVETLSVDLRDDEGCSLVGLGGIDYEMEGGLDGNDSYVQLSTVVSWFLEPWTGSQVEEVFGVEAVAVGEGRVVARAPSGTEMILPISVVDASAVAQLSLTEPEPAVPGETVTVYAHATDADGVTIHDPDCEWSIVPADGPIELDDDWDHAELRTEAPGQATVRCTLGEHEEEVTVVFE